MVDLPPPVEPRRHHYVPRFLLKKFAEERRPGRFQIRTFDKENGRAFFTNVENVAVESDFNALQLDGLRISLEAGMGKIESDAAASINRILANGTLQGISLEDRAALDIFCALQLLRGTAFRNQFAGLAAEMRNRIAAVAQAENVEVAPECGLELGDDDLKVAAFNIIVESLINFARTIGGKDLLLFKAAVGHPFLLGDNPIGMDNERQFGPYGNIGLAVPGIQIYLPISPEYSLAYWCPSILQERREAVLVAERVIARARMLMVVGNPAVARQQPAFIADATQIRDSSSSSIERFEAGEAQPSTPDNVMRLNSVQIRTAERWVMSRDGNFQLVERMIGDNENFRRGHRFRFD